MIIIIGICFWINFAEEVVEARCYSIEATSHSVAFSYCLSGEVPRHEGLQDKLTVQVVSVEVINLGSHSSSKGRQVEGEFHFHIEAFALEVLRTTVAVSTLDFDAVRGYRYQPPVNNNCDAGLKDRDGGCYSKSVINNERLSLLLNEASTTHFRF